MPCPEKSGHALGAGLALARLVAAGSPPTVALVVATTRATRCGHGSLQV